MAKPKNKDNNIFESSIDKFIAMLEKVEFKGLTLLTDGGIICAEIFVQGQKKGYTLIGRIRRNVDVIMNGVRISLEGLSKQVANLTSVIVYIPGYRHQVKLVIDGRPSTRIEEKNKQSRVVLSSDISRSTNEILRNYSVRTYIKHYFKGAKNELDLKSMVYSDLSMLRHTELVNLLFSVWMISQFWLNVKGRMRLRDFVEGIGIFCYVILFKVTAKDSRFVRKLKSSVKQTCITLE